MSVKRKANSRKLQCTQEEFDALNNCVSPYSLVYDPLKSGSIDRIDCEPHDRAVCRALNSDYKPKKSLTSRPECTIFVSRLNKKTTEKTLIRLFSEFGTVKNCWVIRNIVTGASRRYAFIEFENENSAELAYRTGNKIYIDDFEVLVDFECQRTLPGWVPRRLGGGFCGKKESGQLRFGCRDKPFKKPIKMLTKKEMLKLT